jgi:RNA polymerase sigma factor (sigma-70 family)
MDALRDEFSSALTDFAEELAEFETLLTRYPVGHSGHNRRTVSRLYPFWRDGSVSDKEFFHWLLLWSRSVVCYRCRFLDTDKRMDSIAGDAARAIFCSAKNFNNKSQFTSWAYTIIRRNIADYWRRTSIVVRNAVTYSLDEQLETLAEKFDAEYDGSTGGGEHLYKYGGNEHGQVELDAAANAFINSRCTECREIAASKLEGKEDAEIAAALGLTKDQVKYRYRKVRTYLQKRIQPLRKFTLAPLPAATNIWGATHHCSCAHPPSGESIEALPSNSPTSKPFACLYPGRALRTSLDEHLHINIQNLLALKVSSDRAAWICATYPLNFNQGPVDGEAVTARKAADRVRDPIEPFDERVERERQKADAYRVLKAQLLFVSWQSDWHENGARFEPLSFPKREARYTPWKIFKRRGRPKKPIAVKTILVDGVEHAVSVFAPAKRKDEPRRFQKYREKFLGCVSVT